MELNWDLEEIARKNPAMASRAEDNANREMEQLKRAKIVDELESFLIRYAVLPAAAPLPITCWIIATYFSTCFDAFSYLLLNSPMPRCGKTRVEEMLEITCWHAWRGSQVSEAAIFRMITGDPPPTLLFDETEFLSRANKNDKAEAITALLNSGYRQGQTVPRIVPAGKKFMVQLFPTYCPKALAAIGRLPDSIVDRCLVITMQRRAKDEKISRFRFKKAKEETAPTRAALEMEMKSSLTAVSEAYEAAGDHTEFSDRDAELLAPLLAVAQVFCPQRIDELLFKLMFLCGEKSDSSTEDNFKTKLLSDLRAVWPAGEDSISTKELISRLAGMEDSHWSGDGQLNPRKISRMLSGFGVRPHTVRSGSGTAKGYRREPLAAAWTRYLSTESVTLEEETSQNVTSSLE